MINKIKALQANTLWANSFYLLLSSGAVAGFGFIFWAVIARQFADTEVGLAATLLSLSSLISLLSLAGFDTTFVRFLSKSERRQDYINSGLMIAAGLSGVLSVIFLLLFPVIAPDLLFVIHNPWYVVCFIVFNIFTTLNTLTNSIFLGYRKAVYTLVINILFSIVKVVLPFVIVSGGAMTIFTISGIAQVVGAILSFALIRAKFGHTFLPKVHMDILRLAKKYSLTVYGSAILNLLPPTIIPLMVTQMLGAEYSAYYYMTFTIATLLYTVAYSAMQSVFAESSHAEHELSSHLKKASKILLVIMVPSILLLGFLAPYILGIFGANYATYGTVLLQIFCISALGVSVYSGLGTLFKVQGNIKALLLMNIAYCGAILGFTFLLLETYGLNVVGYAWLFGNIAAAAAGLVMYKRSASSR